MPVSKEQDQRRAMTAAMVAAAIVTPGETPSELREAIEQQAAAISSATAETKDVPPEVATFVAKVARNAYKVTDEDIVVLQQLGYTEDGIFEMTVNAAIGAGMARLQQALAVLKGDQQ